MTDLEIFHNAPEGASPEELASYLEEACGDDGELCTRVESLFAKKGKTDDFLEEAAPENLPSSSIESDTTVVGGVTPLSLVPESSPIDKAEGVADVIGNYRLLEKIGEGGFGTVWRAEQSEPVKREVALKIIKRGHDSDDVIRRFELERQSLALMDHPNIAKVHDAGETGTGRPYFVMELVKGESITTYCDKVNLSVRERLELFVPICRAVQHAHAKGIIHRDLKPSNVIVAEHDGAPIPKVIDFGIAKAIEPSPGENAYVTVEGMFVGTPVYMSPEQIGSGTDVDTRADVYSLGVLLYELLVGSPPISPDELISAGYAEMERMICEQEPLKPSLRVNQSTDTTIGPHRKSDRSRLMRSIRGDLDWIVMKALEKSRDRRYETVSGLAQDIENFLADEPVSAAAPTLFYKLGKLVRRHRKALGAAAIIFALIVVGGVVSTLLAIKATRAERQAEASRIDAEHNERVITFRIAEKEAPRDNPSNGLARLAKMLREDPSNRLVAERLMLAILNRDFAIPETGRSGGSYVRISPGGKTMLVGNQGGFNELSRVDERDGKWEYTEKWLKLDAGLMLAGFSPDGQRIITACERGERTPPKVEVRDWSTGNPVIRPIEHQALVQFADFSPDGTKILSVDDLGTVKVSDIRTENILNGSLKQGPLVQKRPGPVIAGDWHPDGRRFAIAANSMTDSAGEIWEIQDGKMERLVAVEHTPAAKNDNQNGILFSILFNHDGSRFVTAGSDGTARIWDTATGAPIGVPMRHKDQVAYAEFSPDGDLVVTASWDGTARVWDATLGQPVTESLPLSGRVTTAHFDPGGLRVIAGCTEGNVKVWDALTGASIGAPFRREGAVATALFHPDPDRPLVVVTSASKWQFWRIQPRTPKSLTLRHEATDQWRDVGRAVYNADFSPDGKRLVSAASEPRIRIWDTDTGAELDKIESGGLFQSAQFNADGERVLTASSRTGVSLYRVPLDGEGAELIGKAKMHAFPGAEFHPDPNANLFVSAGSVTAPIAPAWIWNIHDTGKIEGRPLFPKKDFQNPPLTHLATFSKKGNLLATGSQDRRVRIWDVSSGKLLRTLQKRHALHEHLFAYIEHVDFSPDGSRILVSFADKRAIIWDISDNAGSDQRICEVRHRDEVTWAEFSPDGRRFVTASIDKTARVWDAKTGDPVGLEMRHEANVSTARFSSDGGRIVTASRDKTARVWDAETGFPLSDPLRHDGFALYANFSPDGNRVVSTGDDTTVRLWDLPPAPQGNVPEWVPRWVESVIGLRFGDDNTLTELDIDENDWDQMRQEIAALPNDDYYARIAKWYYAESGSRTISPFSHLTLDDYVEKCLGEESLAGYEEAVRVAPLNGIALGSLALLLRENENDADPAMGVRVAVYSNRAIELCKKMLEKNPADLRPLLIWLKLEGRELDFQEIAKGYQEADESRRPSGEDKIPGVDKLIRLLVQWGPVEAEIAARQELKELVIELKRERTAEAFANHAALARRLWEIGNKQESLEEWTGYLDLIGDPGTLTNRRLEEAASHYQHVAKGYREVRNEELALKNHARALELQQRLIERLRPHPNKHYLLTAMRTRARWAAEFKDWEIAEPIYKEMLGIAIAEKRKKIAEGDIDLSFEQTVSTYGMLLAATYLEMGGREEDYRKLCERMLDEMPAGGRSLWKRSVQQTVRMCAAAEPGFALERRLGIAETANDGTNTRVSLGQGMVYYRQGKYPMAANKLEDTEEEFKEMNLDGTTDVRHLLTLTQAYQALTAARTENWEEAREMMSDAEESYKHLIEPLRWFERVFIRHALEEARDLLADS